MNAEPENGQTNIFHTWTVRTFPSSYFDGFDFYFDVSLTPLTVSLQQRSLLTAGLEPSRSVDSSLTDPLNLLLSV